MAVKTTEKRNQILKAGEELFASRRYDEITMDEIARRVKIRKDKYGEFPVMIRADFAVPHKAVAQVMNACCAAGIWKISFTAVQEDKTHSRKRLKRVK